MNSLKTTPVDSWPTDKAETVNLTFAQILPQSQSLRELANERERERERKRERERDRERDSFMKNCSLTGGPGRRPRKEH